MTSFAGREQPTPTPGTRYRLKSSTIAIVRRSGKPIATTVPPDAIVVVIGEASDSNRSVSVRWEERLCEMFVVDLQERGEVVGIDRAGGRLPF